MSKLGLSQQIKLKCNGWISNEIVVGGVFAYVGYSVCIYYEGWGSKFLTKNCLCLCTLLHALILDLKGLCLSYPLQQIDVEEGYKKRQSKIFMFSFFSCL